jgi:PPM family protein phosphatase
VKKDQFQVKNGTSEFDDPGSEGERALPGPFSSEVDVDVFATSHKGRVRSENEDHFLVVRVGRSLETVFSDLIANRPGDRFEETAYGMIVADGVGGEFAGEVASDEAIFSLLNLALRTPDWQFRWGPREKNTVMWRMRDRFRLINTALLEQAAANAALQGMSTTMTAALTLGKDLIIGHIGDSRAYLLHDGELKRLTRDHTLAERSLGEQPDAERDPFLSEMSGMLMQALGSAEGDCKPDIHDYVLEDGDRLLLCTDGLTDMVQEETIEAILSRDTTAAASCRSLVDLALSNGGHDNITAIVAHYRIPLPS